MPDTRQAPLPRQQPHLQTWLACLNAGCTIRYFDTDRGLIQYTDGHVETWAEQPTTSQPPTITIEDETDGRPDT